MRGDIARLARCTAICTQGEDTIRRSKPFKYAYEKEIVMYESWVLIPSTLSIFFIDRYAYFKKLDYFSTECIYSPDAYRGHARAFLKDIEAARPSAIIDIIHSGEAFEVREEVKAAQKVQRKSLQSSSLLCLTHTVHGVVNSKICHWHCACSYIGVRSLEICQRCGYMSSNTLCKACTLLEGLERGIANAGIVSTPWAQHPSCLPS